MSKAPLLGVGSDAALLNRQASMAKIGIVAAAWVVAVTSIACLFATERIAWPEVWLPGATMVATAVVYFVPRRHWWWVVGSPLIGVAATVATGLVVLFLSRIAVNSGQSRG